MVGILVVDDNLQAERHSNGRSSINGPAFTWSVKQPMEFRLPNWPKAFVRTSYSWMSECRAWTGSRRPGAFERFFLIPL